MKNPLKKYHFTLNDFLDPCNYTAGGTWIEWWEKHLHMLVCSDTTQVEELFQVAQETLDEIK